MGQMADFFSLITSGAPPRIAKNLCAAAAEATFYSAKSSWDHGLTGLTPYGAPELRKINDL